MPAPEFDFAVSTCGLGTRHFGVETLRDVSLEVPLGAVYLVVGANGAGKSTLLNALLYLPPESRGSAHVLGLDVRTEAARVRANVGFVPGRPDWGARGCASISS